jgi:hypothetical protein
MSTTLQRRRLVFNDLDAVVRDAESLLATGYEKAGNWDLAQVSGHLADWMRFPVEGFPKPPVPIRAMLWVMKKTIGPKKLRQYLAEGDFPSGQPTAQQTVPPPGGDATTAVDKLRSSVERLKAHNGPIVPSPFFGPMDKETCVQLQLVHCAHHLSFLSPKTV